MLAAHEESRTRAQHGHRRSYSTLRWLPHMVTEPTLHIPLSHVLVPEGHMQSDVQAFPSPHRGCTHDGRRGRCWACLEGNIALVPSKNAARPCETK